MRLFDFKKSSVLLATCMMLNACSYGEQYPSVRDLAISPDNQEIMYGYCWKVRRCSLVRQRLDSNERYIYEPQNDTNFLAGSYSPDGRQLTFVAIKQEEYDLWASHIAIMNIDGSGFRRVTNGRGHRYFPSFSHDVKKVIYRKCGSTPATRTKPLETKYAITRCDVFESQVIDNNEKRLTNFEFYVLGPPQYFPGDISFLFSAYGVRGAGKLDEINNIVNARQKLINQPILKSSPNQQYLEKFFEFSDDASNPRMSRNGERIAFVARIDTIDEKASSMRSFQYEVFIKIGEEFRRVTKEYGYIGKLALSNDGSLVAYSAASNSDGQFFFYTIGIDGSNRRQIPTPTSRRGMITISVNGGKNK